MTTENLIRDVLELGIVVAIGGMIVTSVKRLRSGAIKAQLCSACERPISRAYQTCPRCGAAQFTS